LHVRLRGSLGSLDTVVVELVTLLVVTDCVAGFSTVVVAGVVIDCNDAIEDVREVELVEKSPEVNVEDVNVDDVDDVSVLVEGVMKVEVDITLVDTTSAGVVDVELAEVIESSEVDDVAVLVEGVMTTKVDVALVDATSAGVVDVELVDVRESSEVLDKEVTSDVEDVVVVGVVKVVSAVEGSIDVADELEGVIVCDSRVMDATEVGVGSEVESEMNADVEEGLVTVELSIC